MRMAAEWNGASWQATVPTVAGWAHRWVMVVLRTAVRCQHMGHRASAAVKAPRQL